VTGYNIMGFDFQYIYRRAQELSKLLAADLELGRIRPERTPRNGVEQRLSSSAPATTTCRTSACPAASCSTR
jgi:DNA polymerase elongation subunit (family B)